jgi:hypothetical protein
MSMILIFTGKWNRLYRVLRYSKRFGLFDSVRYGLWLARGYTGGICDGSKTNRERRTNDY